MTEHHSQLEKRLLEARGNTDDFEKLLYKVGSAQVMDLVAICKKWLGEGSSDLQQDALWIMQLLKLNDGELIGVLREKLDLGDEYLSVYGTLYLAENGFVDQRKLREIAGNQEMISQTRIRALAVLLEHAESETVDELISIALKTSDPNHVFGIVSTINAQGLIVGPKTQKALRYLGTSIGSRTSIFGESVNSIIQRVI